MNSTPVRLSRRETEVARLVAEGLTNREIAERLYIAERTAEGHVEQIRNKLGFRTRSQIAAWVGGQGRAISPPPTAAAPSAKPQSRLRPELRIARRWLWAGGAGMGLLAIGILVATVLIPALSPSIGGARINTFAGTGFALISPDNNPRLATALISPNGLALSQKGVLYLADGNRIRKIGPDGLVQTVAGTGDPGFAGDGGPAIQARLSVVAAGSPELVGIALDSRGDLFFSDTDNNRVREITPDGIIRTVAGSGPLTPIIGGPSAGDIGDGGPGTKAILSEPHGLAVDSLGNLLIADTGDNRIRMLDSQGIISTIAGSGQLGFAGDGGPASTAELSAPEGLAMDTQGDLFIADAGNERIRKVTNGMITTIAGHEAAGFSGDNGPATKASLNLPLGLSLDIRGNLYVADSGNNAVRRVDLSDTITTVAGNGRAGFSGDSKAATGAMLNLPVAVAISDLGALFIADSSNNRIRIVQLGGS